MKVFVTGGNGFIGSRVVRRLAEHGHEIRCLLRPTSNTDRIEGIRYARVDGDVRDIESIRNGMVDCDAAIHLAGLSNWNDIDSPLMREVVVGGTRNLLKVAGTRKVRVVYVSSDVAVNGSKAPRTFDESAEWTLTDKKLTYSDCKREAEKLCVDAWHDGGLPVIVVNPSEVYGPNDVDLITAGNLVDFARTRLVLVCTGGTSVVHVDDVAAAVVSAMDRGAPGERYIAGGENLTLRQLAELSLDILGQKKRIVTVPNGLLRGLASVAQRLRVPMPFNTHVIPYATRFWFMDSSKARRELGVSFRSARETLTPTIQWLKETGRIST